MLAIKAAPEPIETCIFMTQEDVTQSERRLEFKLLQPLQNQKWTKSIKNEILVYFLSPKLVSFFYFNLINSEVASTKNDQDRCA